MEYSEAEINPYGVDIVDLLEDEVFALQQELIKMIRVRRDLSIRDTKNKKLVAKRIAILELVLNRLYRQHPEGPSFFLDEDNQ